MLGKSATTANRYPRHIKFQQVHKSLGHKEDATCNCCSAHIRLVLVRRLNIVSLLWPIGILTCSWLFLHLSRPGFASNSNQLLWHKNRAAFGVFAQQCAVAEIFVEKKLEVGLTTQIRRVCRNKSNWSMPSLRFKK